MRKRIFLSQYPQMTKKQTNLFSRNGQLKDGIMIPCYSYYAINITYLLCLTITNHEEFTTVK